jgi:hypothetical protein
VPQRLSGPTEQHDTEARQQEPECQVHHSHRSKHLAHRHHLEVKLPLTVKAFPCSAR